MDMFHLISDHPIIVSLINDASVLWDSYQLLNAKRINSKKKKKS